MTKMIKVYIGGKTINAFFKSKSIAFFQATEQQEILFIGGNLTKKIYIF